MSIEKKKSTMIWELTDRGFGSELNNLLYAINYCQEKNISLSFLTNKWNTKIEKGWVDFFKQIPESISLSNHTNLSSYSLLRTFFSLSDLRLYVEQKKIHYLKLFKTNIGLKIFNFSKPKKYLFIHDYFKVVYDFNKDEFENDKNLFKKKMNTILKSIWNLNQKTIDKINQNKSEFNLSRYAVLHIRRGDKLTTGEDSLYSYDKYMSKIDVKNIQCVFVMSDDYRVYEDLVKNYPKLNFYTLIDENHRGHFQSSFNKLSINEKEKNAINLFTEIEIAKEANFFVGSKNSNIYRLIEYFKINNCFDISDFDTEYNL